LFLFVTILFHVFINNLTMVQFATLNILLSGGFFQYFVKIYFTSHSFILLARWYYCNNIDWQVVLFIWLFHLTSITMLMLIKLLMIVFVHKIDTFIFFLLFMNTLAMLWYIFWFWCDSLMIFTINLMMIDL
jgi:hypothetical protein